MTKKQRYFVAFAVAALVAMGGVWLLKQGLNSQVQDISNAPDNDVSLSGNQEYSWAVEEFATGLEVPWDIAFDAKNNLYVTERPGRLKVLSPEGKQLANVAVPNITSVSESGLTGIAIADDFAQTQTIYLYYSYRQGAALRNRISSFIYRDGALASEKPIVDNLPGGSIHNGGRLRFGPDDKLWILTGDAAKPGLAQDLKSLAGKVLRVNHDGSRPADNPFADSLVYSLGHRNPQGIAWHPVTGEVLITEHGQSAHDEINIIEPGKNYGWPLVQRCFSDNNQLTPPVLCSGTDTYAPSGIASLGKLAPTLRNSFIYAGLRGNLVELIEISDGKVGRRQKIIDGQYGRMRAAAQAPDGTVYVSTSNRDGRGQVRAGDDKILKLVPQAK